MIKYKIKVCPKCKTDDFGYKGWGSGKSVYERDYYCKNNHRFEEFIEIEVSEILKPQASAHNKEVPIRFIKNDLPSLMKLAKDMDEPQSPNSDYEASPKVCPECKGLGLCSYKDSGDSVYWQRRCKTCKGTGKPIS